MVDIGTILGWIAFALLGLWRLYWFVTEKKANSEKPKTKEKLHFLSLKSVSKSITLIAFGVVGVQLLGIQLLPMPTKIPVLQYVGFMLVVIGLGIAIWGRKDLGTNWANCYEYQVKKNQTLVTSGIYSYIRHPVYSGIALFFVGSELLVQSYLLSIYFFTLVVANVQAKWEESLLTKHFGTEYTEYMKRTKRFIPFIW